LYEENFDMGPPKSLPAGRQAPRENFYNLKRKTFSKLKVFM